jgi:hypothetical protein
LVNCCNAAFLKIRDKVGQVIPVLNASAGGKISRRHANGGKVCNGLDEGLHVSNISQGDQLGG